MRDSNENSLAQNVVHLFFGEIKIGDVWLRHRMFNSDVARKPPDTSGAESEKKFAKNSKNLLPSSTYLAGLYVCTGTT
jgi:hypothetical protein